jgi:signal transduction histidine kinase
MEAGAADFLEKSRLDATILDRAIRYARQQRNYETELENKVAERTEELARVNEALRLADKRKDEFLATLAHELRNPLAPIRNAIEIMRMAGKNPETMDRARNILDRQTLQLIRLIDDLLDISRITRDKLTLNFDILSIQAVLELAVETTQPLIDRAGLTLKIQIPDEPIKVRGDQLRLAQIFSNILNNAAKYTARGGTVCVAVAREGAQVIVRIRDSGMGIPAEMLPKIFELFAQVDRTLDRSRGGLGIGLSLVRRLTEMHGGTVEAHSEGNDRGTELIVRLPIVNASHPLTDNSVI